MAGDYRSDCFRAMNCHDRYHCENDCDCTQVKEPNPSPANSWLASAASGVAEGLLVGVRLGLFG
jgi:hypothetical protein